MKRPLLAAALVLIIVSPGVQAASSLDAAGARWDALDSAGRASLVQAFTLEKSRSAVGIVRRCLGEGGPEVSTCIVAASRLMMPSTAPLLRQLIRDSTDPVVLSLAARTLGWWRDRHSADLLLWALMTGRGAPEATPHVLEGWLRLNPKHESRYLRWLWATAEVGSDRRREFAVRLITRTHGNTELAHEVRQQLLSAWESWRGGRGALSDPEALRVAWGLFADPRGCRIMFARAGLSMGQGKRDPLLRRLSRSRCRPFVPRDQPLVVDDRLPIPSLPEWSTRTPTTPTAARWSALLSDLEVEAPALARRLARDQARLRAPDDWADVVGWSRLRKPAKFVAPGGKDLARHYAGLGMPESRQPDIHLRQPSWWPSGVLLTIDDGPRPSMGAAMLDVMQAHGGVKAVFFLVASQLTRSLFKDPDATRRLLDRLAADGHEVGFHSMNHAVRLGKHLMWRQRDQIADSVRAFRQLIRRTTGHHWGVTVARLPGGQGRLLPWVNHGLVDAGTGAHMHWELGGHGWGQRTSSSRIRRIARQACRRQARGQKSRVLLHESGRSAKQIGAFVDELRRRCPQRTRQARR